MSREEHDETVVAISTGVAYIIKMGKIIVPIIGLLCGGVIWIGVKAIAIHEWNNSLVKQPQFQAFKAQVIKDDSVIHVRIDTTNKRIDNLPVLRFTKVIQRNGREIEVN